MAVLNRRGWLLMTNQNNKKTGLCYASLAVVARMQADAIEHEWIDWERIPIDTTELLKEKWAQWNYYGGYDDGASLEVHKMLMLHERSTGQVFYAPAVREIHKRNPREVEVCND